MGELDNMLQSRQRSKDGKIYMPIQKTLLRIVSLIIMAIGAVVAFSGLICILIWSDKSYEEHLLSAGIVCIFSGLFCFFFGCIGQAIDDIRIDIRNKR